MPQLRQIGGLEHAHDKGEVTIMNVNATAIHDFPFVGETVAAPPARQAYQILHLAF